MVDQSNDKIGMAAYCSATVITTKTKTTSIMTSNKEPNPKQVIDRTHLRSKVIVEPAARIIIVPQCPLCCLCSTIANHGQPIIKRASATLQGGRPKATTVGPSSSPPATRAAPARHAVDPHPHQHPPPSPSPSSGVRVRGWGRNESERRVRGYLGCEDEENGPKPRSWWVD